MKHQREPSTNNCSRVQQLLSGERLNTELIIGSVNGAVIWLWGYITGSEICGQRSMVDGVIGSVNMGSELLIYGIL